MLPSSRQDTHARQAPPESGAEEPQSLFAALAALAHRLSDGSLVGLALLGLAAVGVLVLDRPGWWLLLSPALLGGVFGLWGIVDRVAVERTIAEARAAAAEGRVAASRSGTLVALHVARAALAGLGILTGFGVAVALLAALLGKVIS